MRRRGRTQVVAPDVHESEHLLEEMRGEEGHEVEPARKKKPRHDGSPGRTPRSGVQRSLARLGMINSPDRREVQTTLEEFMEQLVEGKDLGLEEDDVRTQLAARYGLIVAAFTKILFEQATEEQHKETKGLTKFLAKWRKQMSAGTPERSQSSQSPWSVVGSPAEGTPSGVGTERSFPQHSPGNREEAERETPSTRTFAVIPAPGIYGQDRKAGTGGDTSEPIAEITKAIQQQTTELASLVKAQNESSSEELVFLLRACGQYTVEVGAGEHGAGLATALLSAQAGASTKLRAAGFRQKVTPRLAVGLAGPY